MRILVVDSDAPTREIMSLMLRSEFFNVHTVDSGEEACDMLKLYEYDAAVICDSLVDMRVPAILSRVRTAKVKTSIIVVGSLSVSIEDKVRAFGAGADDYMVSPVSKDEIIARICAIVRRSHGHAQSVITVGELAVNLTTRTVEVAGRRVHLTGKEFAMIELLALRKGQTVAKESLMNHLYGGRDEPELKIIDVFICKLRRKVPDLIETIWGQGYVLRENAAPLRPCGRPRQHTDTRPAAATA